MQSVIGVANLVSMPLYKSILRSDFHRGPCAADGTSFFIGEDISSPVQLSVIGEVKATCINDSGPVGRKYVLRPWICMATGDLSVGED